MSRGQIQSGTNQNPFTASQIFGATPQIRDAAEQICDATEQIWDATTNILFVMDQIGLESPEIFGATKNIFAAVENISVTAESTFIAAEEPTSIRAVPGVSGILCKEQFRVFASYISFRFCLGARLARPQTPAADYFFAPARWWFVEKLVRVPSSLLSCSRGNGNALGSTDFASGRCPSGGEPFQG